MVSTSNKIITKDFTILNSGKVLNPTSNLSIAIPSYNSSKTITKLIESISTSNELPYEVILVDDCSSDNSMKTILENYPWVKIIKLNTNSGPSRARNIGSSAANKEIILFLDSDVVLTLKAIGIIEERHRKNPEIAGLQGKYHWEAANPGLFPSYKALVNHYWFFNKSANTKVNFLVTYACTVKKSILLEMGGFNELYKGADVEDYELGYRISEKYTLLHEPELKVYHHFPGFLKNTKNYIERGSQWFTLFMKNKKFDSSGATSKNQAISRLLGGLSFFSIFLMIVNQKLFVLFAFITLLYLLVNIRFFYFCLQKKGIKYFFLGIFFHYISSIVICFTMLLSVLKYVFKV